MKAKDIAFGGVMVAVTVVTLYLTGVIPINTLSLLTVASCFVPITIMRSNMKTGIFVYIASTVISFFMVPAYFVLLYGLFFGIYGIIKFYIERLKKLPLEIFLKLIVCNIGVTVALLLVNYMFIDFKNDLPLWGLYLIAQPAFLLYDYALTLIIGFAHKKFKLI